jgi:hypothetical protein
LVFGNNQSSLLSLHFGYCVGHFSLLSVWLGHLAMIVYSMKEWRVSPFTAVAIGRWQLSTVYGVDSSLVFGNNQSSLLSLHFGCCVGRFGLLSVWLGHLATIVYSMKEWRVSPFTAVAVGRWWSSTVYGVNSILVFGNNQSSLLSHCFGCCICPFRLDASKPIKSEPEWLCLVVDTTAPTQIKLTDVLFAFSLSFPSPCHGVGL